MYFNLYSLYSSLCEVSMQFDRRVSVYAKLFEIKQMSRLLLKNNAKEKETRQRGKDAGHF